MRDQEDTPRTPDEIDQAIVGLAEQQGALDVEVGRWLLLAHRARLHRHFGMASFAEYVERRLGYGARVTKDKAAVAEALEQLPVLRRALATGSRSWSATRELVRVATPTTEAEWLRASEAKTVREVEGLVRGLRPGDLPSAPKDPLLALHRSVFQQSSDQHALTHDAVLRARRILGPQSTDGDCLAFLCESFLGKAQAVDEQPSYQIAVTICPSCSSTFRPIDGELIEVSDTVHDCALCDGELVGLVPTPAPAMKTWPGAETHVGELPARAATLCGADALAGDARVGEEHVGAVFRRLIQAQGLGAVYREAARALGFTLQTVTRSLRKGCLARDNYCCSVPGCRNALFIGLHHLRKVRDGGPNTPENLITLCSVHHAHHHAGYLGIEGAPSTGLVFRTARGTLYGHLPRRAAA